MSTLATSVNTVLEFLARAISQEKEIKGTGKKEIHLFSDDIISQKKSEGIHPKTQLINEISKVIVYEIKIQNSILFL